MVQRMLVQPKGKQIGRGFSGEHKDSIGDRVEYDVGDSVEDRVVNSVGDRVGECVRISVGERATIGGCR